MSEEINEKNNEELETTQSSKQSSNRKPIVIAFAVLGGLILGGLLFWALRSRQEGNVVPAPTTVSFDDNTNGQAGTTEQTVIIQADQVEKIGLKTETVGETLSSEAMSVAATGTVQPNAYKETPVMSLLGGIVKSISSELGQEVAKGQPLAVIFSDELAASQSRYLSLRTDAKAARQNFERTAKLVRISPTSNAELDQALASLKTAEAELVEHHKHHSRTEKLVEIGAASKEEFEQATTKLKTAEANVVEAKRRYDRAVQVAEINPTSRSEFEQAAVKLQTAESDLATAKQKLLLYGLSPTKVDSLDSPSQITSQVPLLSPVAGTVTKRDINQGEVVEANKELMRVTNLSNVWVIAQVYEQDLRLIREGSGASVTTAAYPNSLFRGHVTYIDPNINPETRTAQARVELDNPNQVLKIGMYVNVAFGSMGTAERTVPVVPSAAVQNINDKQIVFVVTDTVGVYIARPVRLGKENNGQYPVLEGLNVGDQVVTDGSFLLRAELLKQNPTHH